MLLNEFMAAASKTAMNKRTLSIARDVLVYGKTVRQVAEKNGISHVRVTHICTRIRELASRDPDRYFTQKVLEQLNDSDCTEPFKRKLTTALAKVQ